MTEPTVEIKKVSKRQAREWLKHNEVNRKIRPKLVAGYRRDMEAGRWAMTGEPIQISETGKLQNGQHRLTALTQAEGVNSLSFVVVTGLPDTAQAMMDQGKSRNVRDALLIEHGEMRNVTLVAALCRWLSACPEPGPHMSPNLMRTKVTTAEALEAYEKDPDGIEAAAHMGSYMRSYLPGSPTAIAYCWLFFNRIDPDACQEFFQAIAHMEFDEHDPRRAALQRMRYLHEVQGVPVNQESGVMLVSTLTRAWNAWRKGESVDQILARGRQGLIPPVMPI